LLSVKFSKCSYAPGKVPKERYGISKKKSGIEEDFKEREQLLQECVELRREGELRKNEVADAAAAKEKALVADAKKVRDAAMQNLVKVSEVQSPGSSEGDDINLLSSPPTKKNRRNDFVSTGMDTSFLAVYFEAKSKAEERKLDLEAERLQVEREKIALEKEKLRISEALQNNRW
jgi:hypothetical protein